MPNKIMRTNIIIGYNKERKDFTGFLLFTNRNESDLFINFSKKKSNVPITMMQTK